MGDTLKERFPKGTSRSVTDEEEEERRKKDSPPAP
jgi:hypothetical protein